MNRIDDQMLDLLSQRGELVKLVWAFKEKHQVEPYVASREKMIHQRLEKLNRGPLSNESIKTIFQEIMSACLALEKPLKIAFLGPEATFTHQAALSHFGQSAQFVEVSTIGGIFAEVEKKQCSYGVVPVENSNEGSVYQTLDMFIETPLRICGEISLVISLYLMSSAERISDVKVIYSHPQALAQCSRWLANNLPEIPVHSALSTAVAARKAAEEEGAAAIASKLTATLYNLHVLKEKIEDFAQNYTRFWVIGAQSPERSGHDKTSIMFAIKDESGALCSAIGPLSQHGINMTKIESRPLKNHPWEYIFFADVEGHVEDANISNALKEIEARASFLKILGSYPSGL
ncbi:MAG TPA: prephenate dehydratase [Thermodesulfobacteriota bacterium]|nr:prephenate dehydratase [Thermodesulfobacteriota bacterium]